jgi:lipoprotein NlpI
MQAQTTLGHKYFDRGDFSSAALNLREATSKESAYSMLWYYLAEARSGNLNARQDLRKNASGLAGATWPFPVVDLFLGKRSPAAMLAAAKTRTEKCEAQYYLGQWKILVKRKADSIAALRKAIEICPGDFLEYSAAVAELNRIGP